MNVKQNTLAALLVLGIGMGGCNDNNSTPQTVENKTATILGNIGSQHSNGSSDITIAQLREITPALSNIDDRYLNIYQKYIASTDTNISSPATVDEVQSMINEVNDFNLPTNAILDRSFFKKTNGVFEHRFVYLAVENTTTGRTWLNNNLGADYANVDSSNYNALQQATARNDYKAYGSLFQWGRKADGHELINWTGPTKTDGTAKHGDTNVTNDNPSDSLFIKQRNWRVNPDDTLWASESSANSVCPVGYRLPLDPNGADDGENEFAVEINSWSSKDINGSMSSDLKMPSAGFRWIKGNLAWTADEGIYWSGSVVPSDGNNSTVSNARNIYFGNPGDVNLHDTTHRGAGSSVRCIKDQTPAERSASILKEIGNEHNNNKSTVTVAQLKAILPALRDINDDYQDIYQRYIASTDNNFSSPATTAEVQSMINEMNALNLPEHAILDRSFFKKTNGVFEHRFVYLPIESNTTGRTWLNNNLGAEYANVDSSDYNPSQQATAIKDLLANGSLFQWGRKADGHELIEWSTLSGKYATTATKSDNPDDSLLITGSDDWRVDSDDTLWASESSPNNVCPVGYRLPLNPNGANDGENEWYQETKDLTQNIGGLFHSFLKVSTTGIRKGNASIKWSDGGSSNYWSGSVRSDGKALNMGSNWGVLVASDYQVKIAALPVRCIKDQTPAERVATILKEIGDEHRNHKSTVTVAQLKAITPALENINDDYQDSYRSYIASANNNFSSPATRDEVQSMIDEVNRLVPVSDATLADIATQHSSHKSTLTVAKLKAITPALDNIEETNEKWYQSYIEGSDTHFSSPATIEELQSMIDEVNSFNLPDNAILDKNFYKKTHNKFEHRFVYLPVTNSNTGRIWLNNNLGAWYANVGRNIYNPSQQATNANDNYAKGSLFQWGRKADGHELVTRWWGNGTIDQLATTTTKSDNPTDGKFIAVSSDWRVHPNDDLWKGIDAPNNPCPAHYRVPTKKELDIEAQTWNALTADGSMSSLLKIPGPGWLNSNGYGMFYPGGAPRVWDTTAGVAWKPNGTHSIQRTNGQPVRCIKN